MIQYPGKYPRKEKIYALSFSERQLDDLSFNLYCDKIYESFHLGFTGCEGPCRFYDLQIEKE